MKTILLPSNNHIYVNSVRKKTKLTVKILLKTHCFLLQYLLVTPFFVAFKVYIFYLHGDKKQQI